ncbi:putative membrane protein [Candidatus Methanoperedens nitroreducens]|uniref:Putative membrane protein n=1 Tax=Candidatus Methanoperedens nitratireducens TaxID=1392998 RepID=A0A062V665_9EURY|nr:YqaA family protein [Candidatus Methanoperedens nitroreducens]KCZ70875.1 putative membrane protein [Candidatus Methanoperedens nitroreducens]MDJ1420730.1 YqaA family protein [Candidatus Methanoperedens sp.]
MLEPLEGVLSSYGYPGLFTVSFLASTILPLGSEGFVVFLISRGFNLSAVVLVASIGNFLGACTSYYIGFKGRDYIEKYLRIEPGQIERAERYFSKYGSYVLLFTWLPLIGDALTVVSGILRLKFLIFSVFVFTGKFLRYLAVAYMTGAILL